MTGEVARQLAREIERHHSRWEALPLERLMPVIGWCVEVMDCGRWVETHYVSECTGIPAFIDHVERDISVELTEIMVPDGEMDS
jgi:hypothetical protein